MSIAFLSVSLNVPRLRFQHFDGVSTAPASAVLVCRSAYARPVPPGAVIQAVRQTFSLRRPMGNILDFRRLFGTLDANGSFA